MQSDLPLNTLGGKNIADCSLRISSDSYPCAQQKHRWVQKGISCNILLYYPQIIVLSSIMLKAYNHETLTKVFIDLLITAYIVLLMFIPGIFSELILHEYKNIIEILMKQLIRCEDSSLRMEMQHALDYMIMRPYRFNLFGAISLKLSLPLTLASLMASDLVVVLQFTKVLNY
ncbi:uncharacterized protein LOC125052000 [Pieris napi]|uniref:uncharacterized protein LOC125052000 n=1 Tax=Pieris napi TaxID=78633 RepID=UPI001FB8A63D|nr:uncharacterized protein LOC125052000 [Pieris napi]